MPYYGEKHNAYQRTRIKARRDAWIASQGGKCLLCGSQDRLEIDHINPDDKKYYISQIWQRPKLLALELPKCQVLCHNCHSEKTRQAKFLKRTHGIRGYRRGCRCVVCKTAKSKWRRSFYLKHSK